MFHYKKLNSGFSLIELLIASSLGLFLMAGVAAVYFAELRDFNFQQALSQIQDNQRIATYFLTTDIRMAGFIGCARLSEAKVFNTIDTVYFSANSKIFAYHHGKTTATYSNSAIETLLQKSVENSDMLVVQFTDPETLSAHVKGDEIDFTGNSRFKAGDIFSLSNCNQVDLFQAKEAGSYSIIPAVSVKMDDFDPLTQLSLFHSYVFYIAETGRKNLAGNLIYALYRRDLNGPATQQSELLEGVRSMHVYFAVRNSSQNNIEYFTGDQVQDWENVIGVKIVLLMQSLENVNLTPQQYQFDGNSYLPSDRRLYLPWEIDVALRQPS